MKSYGIAIGLILVSFVSSVNAGGWIDLRVRYFQESISSYHYYVMISPVVGWPIQSGFSNFEPQWEYEESGSMARTPYGGSVRVETCELFTPSTYGVDISIYDAWTHVKVGEWNTMDAELQQNDTLLIYADIYPINMNSTPNTFRFGSTSWADIKSSF